MSRFERKLHLFDGFPQGPFECRLLPPGEDDMFYERNRRPQGIKLPNDLTKRERERAIRIFRNLEVKIEGK